MRLLKNEFFLGLLLFFLMLIDGQVSFLASILTENKIFITSHLFLLVALFYSSGRKKIISVSIFLVLGILYDFYYLNHFGIMLLILFAFFMLARKISYVFLESFFPSLFIFIILLFLVDLLTYFLAVFYNITNFDLMNYVTFSIAPSLVFNLFLFLIARNGLKKIFLEK
ncbi:rod shape-determining protein MreD [Streptococcus orisratti]|uniref:rod shape-determining protein MreD n=1 Tax=Streptococcus orisratti TaxID=114652 RepID=UPI0023F6833C|nr:rod shape-determining protein MreD [Streptococcus orisratti]